MTWGIWNEQQGGWVGFNGVIFHAPSKAVCQAQIDLLERMREQQARMRQQRERAQQEQSGIATPQLVIPGSDGKPIPVGPAVWEPVKLSPLPLVPRRFEEWYQAERKGAET